MTQLQYENFKLKIDALQRWDHDSYCYDTDDPPSLRRTIYGSKWIKSSSGGTFSVTDVLKLVEELGECINE